MFNSRSLVTCLCFAVVLSLWDVAASSFLSKYPSSWDVTTRRSNDFLTISEERLENKEMGMFGRTSTEYPTDDRGSSSTSSAATSSSRDFRKKTVYDQGGISSSEEHQTNSLCGPSVSKPLVRKHSGGRQKKQESKAQKWCKEFEKACVARKEQTKSNMLETRITGGRMADPKKNTFMALIGYGTIKNRQWLCGGSLISERYVLTAAHCTEGGTLGRARWVRVGELDLSTRKDDARPEDKGIVERILHPQYKEPAVYNDIALLKLESDVTFNEWVSPICLHTSKTLPSGPVTVAGWGRVDFASSTSEMLLEVEINLFNDSECVRLMGKTKDKMQLPRGIDTDTMICAGEIRGGKDACSGDSGGPLFFEETDCLAKQVGVTSLGRDCGLPNTAGIYTNVQQYIPWIESIVWPDDD